MNYSETIEWMFNRLPMYQNQGASAYRADLSNTILLAQHLGSPEDRLKAIHVAGTNGKGSVSNMLASVLQEAGYKVGLFTSPHLKDFRERIKINGKDITEQYVISFIKKNKSFFEANNLSFFEMTVGLAFDYFVTENVDYAVIETGMGGRLDSTNILNPLVSVITNIGLDHTKFLGDTPAKIAVEKAGIIKPGVPVVIGEYTDETKPVFIAKAREMGSEIYFASEHDFPDYESDLKGDYQKKNINIVLQTIEVLSKTINLSQEVVQKGLFCVRNNTGFSGRWQQVHDNPTAIADTAHNPHGLKPVMKQLITMPHNRLRIVFGVVNDKDLAEILPLLPKNAIYYFCKPHVPRGLDAEVLKIEAGKCDLKGDVYNSVTVAYKEALAQATVDDVIYIGGSTFVVAEIL